MTERTLRHYIAKWLGDFGVSYVLGFIAEEARRTAIHIEKDCGDKQHADDWKRMARAIEDAKNTVEEIEETF